MRTKLYTRMLATALGLVVSAFLAGPAFAGTDPSPTHGWIEICKNAPSITTGAAFEFTLTSADNARYKDTVSVHAGQCSTARPVPADVETVTVTEDDYSWNVLSAVHTLAPGAKDQMLGAVDLEKRTAEVDINSPVDESQATVVEFTNDPVNGYFEICKDQVTGAGLDGQVFNFAWTGENGAAGTASVKVGSCSFPILAPAGLVTITETGTVYVDNNGIWTDRDHDLKSASIGDAQAVVHVWTADPSDYSKESIVHFRNNSSLLKICKVIPGWSSLEGLPYTFSVTAGGASVGTFSVNAFSAYDSDAVYGCVKVGAFPAGASIGVTEMPQPGQRVESIWLKPDGNSTLLTTLQASPTKDYTGQSATFTLQRGENELFFKDKPVVDPHLKICKTGGPVNGSIAFTVTGKVFWPDETKPSSAVLADGAPLALTIPLDATGSGCVEAGNWAYIGPVSVVETIPPSFKVTSVTTSTPDRLKAVTLPTGTALVYMGYGTTVVQFANTDPPTADTSGGGGGSSSSSTPSSGSTSAPGTVTATPTAQPQAAAPAPVKPAKAAIASRVVSVKIVTIRGKRYVSIRMASPNKTARVHLRLVDRHGTVMRNAVRTIKANVTTRILDLPVAKSIVKVRAVAVS